MRNSEQIIMEAIAAFLKPAMDYWLYTDRFSSIEGFLDPIEGYALHLLAAFGPGQGDVVEIGSLYGRSTCYLASGCLRNGRGEVHAVDTFLGSPEHKAGGKAEQKILISDGSTFKTFLRNIASQRLDHVVRPQRTSSEEAAAGWKGPVRLLFIDGDHSYEESRKDFLIWTPHLEPEGMVVMHDIGTWEGVTRFYMELLAEGKWREVVSVGTLRALARNREG